MHSVILEVWLSPNMIAVEPLMNEDRLKCRSDVFWKCIIPDLSLFLNCKYLEDGNPVPNGPAALSSSTSHSFPLVCVFFRLIFQPSFVLFILFLAVSAILYSAVLWSVWACRDQKFSRWSHLLSTCIPSPNLTHTFYFSTFPVYTCTVLLFVLWWIFLCLNICCCPHEELKNDHQHREDDHNSHQHRHISLSLN